MDNAFQAPILARFGVKFTLLDGAHDRVIVRPAGPGPRGVFI